MHTRRVGAFLIGAWLLGSLLMAFVSSQSDVNIERFFSNPPAQVSKELDDVGPEVMRQILRFQASQHIRAISETWEVLQLGIGFALIATSLLTAHRSRIILAATAIMIAMTALQYFFLTPTLNALSRSYDFLPPTAALTERQNFNYHSVWYRVLEILKVIFALIITGRLLFDRYDWTYNVFSKPSSGKRVRRRRRSPSSSSEPAPVTEAATTPDETD